MTRPYAFTFWHPAEGVTPGYIELCQRSHERNLAESFELVQLDMASAREWVPEADQLWEEAIPTIDGRTIVKEGRRIAIFCGMLRVALIHRHGGLWVDADTLVFPQFALLADLVNEFDLVCGEAAAGNTGNAVIGGRPGSPFFERYWNEVYTTIKGKNGEGLGWGEVGFKMVRQLFEDSDPQHAWVAPWGVINTVNPVATRFGSERPTFQTCTVADALSPNALDVSIYNNGTQMDFRSIPADELAASDTMIGDAYRIAMGEVESDHLTLRTVSQLRALNRSWLTHRLLVAAKRRRSQIDHLRSKVEQLHTKLTKRRAQVQRLRGKLDKRDAHVRRLRAQAEERNRSLVKRLRTRVRSMTRGG